MKDWSRAKASEIVSFDCETWLAAPGLAAPPLVCASVAREGDAFLLDAGGARRLFRELMRSDYVVAGANFPYDVGVMLADAQGVGDYPELRDAVLRKYGRGEIWDVLVGEALDAIERGFFMMDPRTGGKLLHPITRREVFAYSLEVVTWLALGRADAKRHDFWRKRYAILERVPMADWPEDARLYPLDDARNTRDLALAQVGAAPRAEAHEWRDVAGAVHCDRCKVTLAEHDDRCFRPRPIGNLESLDREVRADLALHLSACWGIRTERASVDSVSAWADRRHGEYVDKFRELEFISADHSDKCADDACRGCKKDGPAVKRRVALAYGADPALACPSCGGAGKRPSPKTSKPVWCTGRTFKDTPVCDGTGLDLDAAPQCPRTPTGGVVADRDALTESGDDDLVDFGANQPEKTRGTYVPFLREGLDWPLTLSPNVLVSSLRSSYRGVIQQFPTDGLERACVVARRA